MPARYILTSSVVGTAAAADAGVSMFTANPMIALIERFGLIIALLLYFIWLNHKHQQEAKADKQETLARLKEANDKIDENNDKHEKFMEETIQKNTEAITSIKEIVKECPNRAR